MQADEKVLAGFDISQEAETVAAVLHLQFEEKSGRLVVTVAVGAVAMSHRSQEPPYLGDEIMAVAEHEARTAMRERNCTGLALAGFIHTRNNASMRMASRNNWTPLQDPSTSDGYMPWGRLLV